MSRTMLVARVLSVVLIVGCGGSGGSGDASGSPNGYVADAVTPDVEANDGLAQDIPADMVPDAAIPDPGVPVDVIEVPEVPETTDAEEVEPDPGTDPGPPDPPDGEVSPCDVAPPLEPFQVGIQLPPGDWGPAPTLSGDATVTYRGPYCCDYDWDNEVRFLLASTQTEVVVRTKLPGQYEIPVAPGEPVKVFFKLSYVGEAMDQYAVVWGSDGHVRFLLYSAWAPAGESEPLYDCGGMTPCPNVTLLETTCPAQPETCGDAVHPPVRLDLGPGWPHYDIAQGETHTELAAAATVKVIAAHIHRNLTMDCMDYPDNWVELVLFDNFHVSQCSCHDRFDCSVEDVCETEALRCLRNRCLEGPDCMADGVCDPYTGKCVPLPISPVLPCVASADCPVGGACNYVCNTYLGFCQMSPCCVADCAGGCSPLLDACYGCLSDCDCLGTGSCDQATHQCV